MEVKYLSKATNNMPIATLKPSGMSLYPPPLHQFTKVKNHLAQE